MLILIMTEDVTSAFPLKGSQVNRYQTEKYIWQNLTFADCLEVWDTFPDHLPCFMTSDTLQILRQREHETKLGWRKNARD